MIADVPVSIPDTIPLEDPIAAMALLLLVQTPPGVALDSVVVPPMHRFESPAIGLGDGITVNTVEDEHPIAPQHTTVATPGAKAIAMPVLIDIAIAKDELDHVLPGIELVNVAEPPSGIVAGPVITGVGLTVTIAVTAQPAPSE